MASTMGFSFPIDPTKAAKYPVFFSQELLEENAKAARQNAIIQFNHKPDFNSYPIETRITPFPSSQTERYHLAIKADDDGSTYLYSGTQQPSESFALIHDPTNQSFTLERISSDFTFNLRSTPTVKSSKALASTYPYLDTGLSDLESSSDEPEDNDLESTDADPNNPYDYRHFLEQHRTSSPATPDLTPLAPPSPPRRTAPRPKPKPRPAPPHPKRAPSPLPREEADADNEESDDGGLTIEFDPDTKRSRFQGAFSYDIRNGPISLRSAASSVSPAPELEESSESDEDENVEDMQLKENGVRIMQTAEEDEEEDEEDDNDEEENEEEKEEDEEEDEEYGSLEAELEQALVSQADEEVNGFVQGMENGIGHGHGNGHGLGITHVAQGIRRNPVHDDSSSESEEE